MSTSQWITLGFAVWFALAAALGCALGPALRRNRQRYDRP
jgi:hypothetical protein